ncbi:MAG: EamA family transporter [Nanoarchaeota archaeon]
MSPAAVKATFFILIAATVILEVIADVLFKKWTIGSRNLYLGIGLFIYFAGTVFWAFSLKYEFLSKAISVFSILNLVIIVLVGVFMFNEHLSLINKIGIALGVLSVIFIEI